MNIWIQSILILVCGIACGSGIWYLYDTYRRSHTYITIEPHTHLTQSAYRCIRESIPYILQETRDPRVIHAYIQYAMPHIHRLTTRWKDPHHLHIRVALDAPRTRITHQANDRIITDNAHCISDQYIPNDVHNTFKNIRWRSHDPPEDVTDAIACLHDNIPASWWDRYTIVWHSPQDIRLYAQQRGEPHIRTRAHRQVTRSLMDEIENIRRRIRTANGRTPQTGWIDIRCARHAIVSDTLRGGEQ